MDTLPEELLISLLYRLKYEDLLNYITTNSLATNLLNNQIFWQNKFHLDFGNRFQDYNVGNARISYIMAYIDQFEEYNFPRWIKRFITLMINNATSRIPKLLIWVQKIFSKYLNVTDAKGERLVRFSPHLDIKNIIDPQYITNYDTTPIIVPYDKVLPLIKAWKTVIKYSRYGRIYFLICDNGKYVNFRGEIPYCEDHRGYFPMKHAISHEDVTNLNALQEKLGGKIMYMSGRLPIYADPSVINKYKYINVANPDPNFGLVIV